MNRNVRLLLIALMAMVPFVGGNLYAALSDGLISAWTFNDGTANDGIGNNHGNLMNGASTAPGNVGQALDLQNPENPPVGENTGQYVEIPSSPTLEQEDGVFTVAF